MTRALIVCVTLTGLALAAYGAYRSIAPATPRYGYVQATVELGKLRETITATGTVRAVGTVEVGSQVSGQINQLHADFNDAVSEGQTLAQLDQRSVAAKLAEARAAVQLAKAQAKIQKAAVEGARIDILDAESRKAVLEARLDSSRAGYGATNADYRRKVVLREQGNISAREFDQVKSRRTGAAAAIREVQAEILVQEQKIARANTDLARAYAEFAGATALLQQREAARQAAEVDLARTTIRSPIDGIVIKRNVERGQTVAASLEAPNLFTIAADLREMEVAARIDETDIGRIGVGQQASFSVDAYPGRPFRGRVTQIRKAPIVVQNVVTYAVIIRTTNRDLLLFPGMTALVEILVLESEEVLKVPGAAAAFAPSGIVTDADSTHPQLPKPAGAKPGLLWRLAEDGTPEPIPTWLGASDATSVRVLGGSVAAGDVIIVHEIATRQDRRLFGIRIGI